MGRKHFTRKVEISVNNALKIRVLLTKCIKNDILLVSEGGIKSGRKRYDKNN